jgi:hypothetical protein
VPAAGDIGVDGREIGYLFSQQAHHQLLRGRRHHRQTADLGWLTGPHGGDRLRHRRTRPATTLFVGMPRTHLTAPSKGPTTGEPLMMSHRHTR